MGGLSAAGAGTGDGALVADRHETSAPAGSSPSRQTSSERARRRASMQNPSPPPPAQCLAAVGEKYRAYEWQGAATVQPFARFPHQLLASGAWSPATPGLAGATAGPATAAKFGTPPE